MTDNLMLVVISTVNMGDHDDANWIPGRHKVKKKKSSYNTAWKAELSTIS